MAVNVTQWNCRGLRLRAAQLKATHHNKPQERPDAYLLQEVYCTTVKLTGYKSYANPSIPSVRAGQFGGQEGQAMVYIKKHWPQHEIDLQQWCTEHQEVVAVRTTQQDIPVILVSVYYRPGASVREPRDHGWIAHLDGLYPKEQKIVGGDFNLQHTAWGYAKDTSAGQNLLDEMTHHRYTLMNTAGMKTRLSCNAGQNHTTPDTTWTNSPHTAIHTWKPEADTRGSDHLPIRIVLALNGSAASKPGKRLVHVVNWDLYRSKLQSSTAPTVFESIKEALLAATTKKQIKLDTPIPDLHLLNLWARRLRALQRYRRGPKNARALREVTRATVAARKYAVQLDRQKLLEFSASLSEKTSAQKLWAVSRAMLGKTRDRAATLTLALTRKKTVETLAQEAGDTLFPQPAATSTPPAVGDPYERRILQRGIDVVTSNLQSVGLTASPDKTTYVVIAPRRERDANISSTLHLTLAGQPIRSAPEVRILGLQFHEDGTAKAWLTMVAQQCQAALNVIGRISGTRGGADKEVARRMVKTLIVSRICYGARHYRLTNTQWKKLEILTNNAARIVTGLPRYTPLDKLKAHAKLNTARETVEERARAHLERLQHSASGRQILEMIGSDIRALPPLPEVDPPWSDDVCLVDDRPVQRGAGPSRPGKQACQVRQHCKLVQEWTDTNEKLAVYTDAAFVSFPKPICSAAVVIPRLGITMAETLPGGTSVKGGELGAIQLALRTVIEKEIRPTHLQIFTDFAAALIESRSRHSPNKRVKAIRRMASDLIAAGTTIKVSWIPAHADIQGNVQAHCMARAHLDSPREPSSVPSHLQEHGYSLPPELGDDGEDPDYDPEEAKQLVKESSRQTLRAALTPCVNPLPSGMGRGSTVLLRRIITNTTCTPARRTHWTKPPTSPHCSFCQDPSLLA
ncbi:uncharacterized protein LOC120849846, partial [Ixodes scapularis]|uniref:uncharacterized protein LOC120849846 n=1 Tax=Ixodes scapularis TaxID=6945 RepID=UPI001C381C87